MRAAPRSISPADRKALQRQLKLEADSGRLIPLRNRALFLLAWSSGLRLAEVLALTVAQVLDFPPREKHERGRSRPPRWRVRSSTYVKVSQAKGGTSRDNGARTWTSAGTVVIPARARRAIGAYVKAAVAHGAVDLVTPEAPLWVQPSSGRQLQPRTIQYQWTGLQRRAGCVDAATQPYHFHCLRHDALTRFSAACGGDVFQVAAFGRCDPFTAQRYVHVEPRRLAKYADAAEAF